MINKSINREKCTSSINTIVSYTQSCYDTTHITGVLQRVFHSELCMLLSWSQGKRDDDDDDDDDILD